MSKRRPGLKPRDRDDWPTPWPAVLPLLPHLKPHTSFVEPCAGGGELVGHLERAGHRCVLASDLPTDARIARYDIASDAIFVTNLPFRKRFEPGKIIENLSDQRPLWAIIYSDWLFTTSALPYLPRLRAIAAIGRVRWIPGSPTSGMENSCWCLFDRPQSDAHAVIRFMGREKASRGGPGKMKERGKPRCQKFSTRLASTRSLRSSPPN
jgi:hypothetical protein